MAYVVSLISNNNGTITTTNVTRYVTNGFSFLEKLDDSLDVGQIVLRGLSSGTPYTMFDTIKVMFGAIEVFSLRIAGDSVSLISKSPKTYEHTLTLVEHTKVLELFTISAKTFTQPTDSVLYYLYDVIEILKDTTPTELTSDVASTRNFVLPSSGALYTLLTTTQSPEFSFKNAILKEALYEVCSYINGIPRLFLNSSNELEFTIDFVNDLNDLIESETNFTSKKVVQDTPLYADTIISDVENMVEDTYYSGSVETYPSAGTYTTSRTDGYVYDFLNSFVRVGKPIYNIINLNLIARVTVGSALDTYDKFNSDEKFYYYPTFADFPTTGIEDVWYVDISDSEQLYYWSGSAYVLDGSATTNTFPKIRYFTSYDIFEDSGSGFANDIFIDTSTLIAYRYDATSTSFVVLNHIDGNGNLILDCSDRVLEDDLFQTKIADASDRTNPTKYYQSNTFHYKYKTRDVIVGETSGMFGVQAILRTITEIKAFEMLQDDGIIDSSATYSNYVVSVNGTNYENNQLYQVSYVPVPNSTRISNDRDDITDVSRTSELLNNQQLRIVNLENFTNNMKARINRIGNSTLQLSNRVKVVNDDDVYNIGDYTDDMFIITKKESIFFKDYIDISYELSKNYNKISEFLGLNSEIRQWEIGTNNILDRNILYREFIEIDAVESGSGLDTSNLITLDGKKCFIETFYPNSTYEQTKGGILNSSETTENFLVPFSSNGGGNNLIFSFQLDHNRSVGNSIETISGQSAMQYNSYTDSSGNLTSVVYSLFDKLVEPQQLLDDQIEIGKQIPKVDITKINKTYIETTDGMYILKDSRENLGQTIQFSMIPKDSNTVVLGKNLAIKNRLISELPPTAIKLFIYENNIKFGRLDNKKALSGSGLSVTLSPTNISIIPQFNKILITHPNLTSSASSWCLTDEDDNILIAVNQDGDLLNSITFDFNNKRSGINYKY